MSNRYVITNNPILYADTTSQIQNQVNNIYSQLSSISYTPGTITMLDDLGINCGDIIEANGNTFYVMKKSISSSGVVLECVGSQERDETSSLNSDIRALRGKSVSLKRDIESFQQTYTDDYAGLQSMISQTAGEIRSEISSTDGRVNTISQTLDGVLFTNGQGQTLIDGAKIETSRINAADLQLSGIISWGDLTSDVKSRISSNSYDNSDVRTFLRNTYGITNTTISGTEIESPNIIGGNIYGGKIYAGGQGDSDDYCELSSEGFRIVQVDTNERAYFAKRYTAADGLFPYRLNVCCVLGNMNPAVIAKFYCESDSDSYCKRGHHIWIGDGDFEHGIIINIQDGTWGTKGLTQTSGKI